MMTISHSRSIPNQLLHTMIRVRSLESSIYFYCDILGMQVLRQEDYPDGGFTLCFLGYGAEASHTVVELTYNYEEYEYSHGDAYGHLALGVEDVNLACERLKEKGVKIARQPGPMLFPSSSSNRRDIIAFIEDPDGYKIELIQTTIDTSAEKIMRNHPTYYL